MAKKAKKDVAEEGADDEGAPAKAGKGGKGGKKKLILIGAALVLLAGGGGGGYLLLKPKPGDKPGEHGEEAAVEKKATAFVDLKEMMVNLAGQNGQQMERPRYLKVKVALEVGDPKLVNEVQPLLPRIEDAFQVYLRELRLTDIEGSAGVYRLREELLRRVNIAVYPAKVDAILFKELLVQ